MNKKVIVFDLDDTLFKEIEYLKSAFFSISRKIAMHANIEESLIYNTMIELYTSKQNVFTEILRKFKTSYSIDDLIKLYRNHTPNIVLSKEVHQVLNVLKEEKIPLGLLTDGRSLQQRSKIKALGLSEYFSEIIISEEFGTEKPNKANYVFFENNLEGTDYYYIGDNIKKDFITPNELGWKTIRLIGNEMNIHQSDESLYSKKYLAKYNIMSIDEIIPLIINDNK